MPRPKLALEMVLRPPPPPLLLLLLPLLLLAGCCCCRCGALRTFLPTQIRVKRFIGELGFMEVTDW